MKKSAPLVRLVNPIQYYLLGKVFTYFINAVVDKKIAKRIMQYIHTHKLPCGGGEIATRARRFILLANKTQHSKSFLIGISYSLEHINGMADHLYAKQMQKILTLSARNFLEKNQPRINSVDSRDYTNTKVEHLFKRWKDIARGDFEHIASYARHHHLQKHFKKEYIYRAIVCVQKENIRANHHIVAILNAKKFALNEKTRIIHLASQLLGNPRIFMLAARKTQESASRWDRLLIAYLRLKMTL